MKLHGTLNGTPYQLKKGKSLADFPEGTPVALTSSRFKGKGNNPIWGGRRGRIVGRVLTNKRGGDLSIKVSWGHGETNVYAPTDLHIYKEKNHTMIQKAKDIGQNLYSSIKPYEKYIGLAALVLVIDHFLFGGKFSGKLKTVAERVLDKIMEAFDAMLEKLGIDLDEATGADLPPKPDDEPAPDADDDVPDEAADADDANPAAAG